MRDSFIMYRSFYEAISDLPKEDKADILDAIFEYSLNSKELELKGIGKTIFKLIRPQLEANNKRFENGNKPKKPKVIDKKDSKDEAEQSETEAKDKQDVSETEAEKSKDEANKNVNVNPNENENDNENEIKEKGEFSENENLLLSENEFIKSELEKAKEIIKALEEKPKAPIKKDVKIFDELVYNFPQDFSDETKDLFMRFLTNRKRMKKEVKTQRALNGLIEKLKPFDDYIRIIAIDNSINANWMDLFPKPEQRAGFDYSKHNSRNGYSNQSIPIRTPTPYVYDSSKD